MNSIAIIKKLAELARLVENWENPTAEFIEDISNINHEPPDCWSFGNGWFLGSPEKIFKEEAIQQAFKAEVRKVARELIEIARTNFEIPPDFPFYSSELVGGREFK